MSTPESSPTPRQNIELKARVPSLVQARDIAEAVATEYLGELRQVDTYFQVSRGRLKLRVIDGSEGQLIAYDRADSQEPRSSTYRLVPVPDPPELRAALSTTCGILCEVDKRREVFLHHNVRIHLDEVQRLGQFLEFEAVLCEGIDAQAGERQVAELCTRFQIEATDIEPRSYSDLLLALPDFA